MSLGINSNSASLRLGNQLNRIDSPLQKSLQQLSSGKKINSAKDNAAGLAIVSRFASQILGSNQAYKNISDGISLTQVADGYTGQLSDLTQRARELAIQSANGSLNDSDRAALQTEFSQIQEDVQRITDSADFNGISLLNNNNNLSIQADSNADNNSQVDIKTVDLKTQLTSNNFFSADITTAGNSLNAITALDNSLTNINTTRADFGATLNRLETAGNNVQNKAINLEASKSRILDADYAKATSELTKNLIKQKAATSMQSHSFFSQNQVLNLLGSA